MRKFLVILFLCSLGYAQTATITGKVVDPGNGNQSVNTKIQMELVGCSGNQPRYNGVAQLWPVIKKYDTDSSGNASGTIIRNDYLTCGTSTDSNKWRMTIIQNGQASPPCDVRIVLSTFDATQPNCLNTQPTIAAPTDTAIWAKLDATNQPFTGNVTAPSLRSKGDPVFNVKAYGAVGDCAANDTVAINLAIAAAQAASNGIVDFPPGCYKFNSTITGITAGLTIRGAGGYWGSSIFGTQFKSNNGTSAPLTIQPTNASSSAIRLEHFAVLGTGMVTGNCVTIDAASMTTASLRINDVVAIACPGHGFLIKGATSTNFLFDVTANDIRSISNGGDGVQLSGLVSQALFIHPYLDASVGAQFRSIGGAGRTVGALTFIQPRFAGSGGIGADGAVFEDTDGVSIFDIYTEQLVASNVTFKSARGVEIIGGTIGQVGTSKGITFDVGATGGANSNIRIDVPGWSNASSLKRFNQVGGSIRELHLGLNADGRFLDTDFQAAFTPTGEIFMDSQEGYGATQPTACRIGDRFFKPNSGLYSCGLANTWQLLVAAGSGITYDQIKSSDFNGPIGQTTTAAGSFTTLTAATLATNKTDITLSNGANNNIAIGTASFVRIGGPTGVFSISGFTGGTDGRILRVYNSASFAMTITNNATSTGGNRILTLTGADVTLRAGQSFATLIYDSSQALWILTATN